MRLGIRFLAGVAAVAGFVSAPFVVRAAGGDELKLKDGTKITGTIVGFDDNSFRVKTNYGFAVVQKDQVVSINITPAAKTDDAEEKKNEPEVQTPASISALAKPAKPEAATASTSADSASPVDAALPVSHAGPTAAQPGSAPTATKNITRASAKGAARSAAALAPDAAAAPTPANAPPAASANTSPASPAPPKPAAPEPVRENVNGNTYTNETYGFQMYKPPDWQMIEGARTILPGTITALGTDDQSTYLLIGQAPAGKTLASDEDTADRRLRDIMENFRPLEVQHVTVSGVAAIERRFRGSVDQHDWSGVVVLVPHGMQLYTIFGMTLADTDLVQIQENVIARAISSLQFTKQ
jgi:hypothetical protein